MVIWKGSWWVRAQTAVVRRIHAALRHSDWNICRHQLPTHDTWETDGHQLKAPKKSFQLHTADLGHNYAGHQSGVHILVIC